MLRPIEPDKIQYHQRFVYNQQGNILPRSQEEFIFFVEKSPLFNCVFFIPLILLTDVELLKDNTHKITFMFFQVKLHYFLNAKNTKN